MSIVVSLCKNYLGYLEDAADRIPQILDHRFRLTPLSVDAAAEAMTGPAGIEDEVFHTKPFRFNPEMVTTVLRFLTEHKTRLATDKAAYVEPFHLQLICQKIEAAAEKQQPESRSDVVVTMNSIGEEAYFTAYAWGILHGDAQHVLPEARATGDVGPQSVLQKFLIGPEGRRRSLDEDQIRQQLGLYQETLQQLVNKRLLRSDSRADVTYYELSHDALVEPIFAALWAKT